MTQFEAIVKLTENSVVNLAVHDTKPIKAYSPAYGWLVIKEVFTKNAPYHEIRCEVCEGNVVYFTRDLILTGAGEHAKQMLFPNKECEDWVTYLYRTKPELKFHIDDLVAYREKGKFILARIADICGDRIEVQVATCGAKQVLHAVSVYTLKEVAKLIKKSKDVQSIQAEN